jgi:hypothetical protein
MMKILFLSRWFPCPADNGSMIRILNILKQLSQRHEVALLAFHENADAVNPETLRALRDHCSTVRALPHPTYRPTSRKALVGLLGAEPRYLVDTYSAELSSAVAGATTTAPDE